MYQILCNGNLIYDPRDDDLILLNPKCNLGANTVGEGFFTILSSHPNYAQLQDDDTIYKSIFEIRQDNEPIFRGRMTNASRDFYNKKDVDLEGVLGFANDTVIPPFKFPDDFPDAESAENVVAYFLNFVLTKHNEQAEDWQQLKLGHVKVSDPNNNIERSSDNYTSTWEILKTRLFESSLGGYLVVRYEADGNYVDYVDNFEDTNPQHITFGENLLDITHSVDVNETYSVIIPLGAEGEMKADSGADYEGDYVTIRNTTMERISLKDEPDGNLTDDLVKQGRFVYSKSAKAKYGWVCAPVDSTTWDDITTVANLKIKAMEYLSETAMLLSDTITIHAVDLAFTDEEIQSFRMYQNIIVNSPVHGISGVSYPLTRLEIDITNPQNTKITLGETKRVLTDSSNQTKKQIEEVKKSNNYVTYDLEAINKELEKKVGNDETEKIVSMINDADAVVELYGKRLRIYMDNFTLEDDGTVTAKNGVFKNASVSGTIVSEGTYGKTSMSNGRLDVESASGHWNVYYGSMRMATDGTESPARLVTFSNTGIEYYKNGAEAPNLDISFVNSQFSGLWSMYYNGFKTTFGNGGFLDFYKNGTWKGSLWMDTSTSLQLKTDNSTCLKLYGAGTNYLQGVWSLTDFRFSNNSGTQYAMPYYGTGQFQLKTINGKSFHLLGDDGGYLDGSWYNSSGSAVTSDRNYKNSIEDMPEAYGVLFDNLRPIIHKYNDGTSDRYHVGFIAQDVDEALQAAELTRQDFAGICIIDEGRETEKWALRYTEFVPINTYEIQKLKARMNELEKRLEKSNNG